MAAAVLPSRLAEVAAAGPATWRGFPVRYLPAEIGEQLDAAPDRESVDAIAYDDEARTSPAFSFDPGDQDMELLLHVGPEHSWDVLKEFLAGVQGPTVSAMYEFHSPAVKEVVEARLEASASFKLVLDNATSSKVKDDAEEFDRVPVFEARAARYRDQFERIVAPEGRSGLISDAYHIKVTVRPDGRFWLSSGNWKMESSQPVITQDQRDHAADVDLPGNREWHVVVDDEPLANRLRSHILQDSARSKELGGGPTPRRATEERVVEVPEEVPTAGTSTPSSVRWPASSGRCPTRVPAMPIGHFRPKPIARSGQGDHPR